MAKNNKSNRKRKKREKKSFSETKFKNLTISQAAKYLSQFTQDGKVKISFKVQVKTEDGFVEIEFNKKYKQFNTERFYKDLRREVNKFLKDEIGMPVKAEFDFFIKDIETVQNIKVDKKNILPEQRENAKLVSRQLKIYRDRTYYWKRKIAKYKNKQRELSDAESLGMSYDKFFELNMKYTQIIIEAEKELNKRVDEYILFATKNAREFLETDEIELEVACFPIEYLNEEGGDEL